MPQSLGSANNRGLFGMVVVLEVVGDEDGTLWTQAHRRGKELSFYAAEALRDLCSPGSADRLCHVPTPTSKDFVRAIVSWLALVW